MSNIKSGLYIISIITDEQIFTQNTYRKENGFTWHPIMEVAKLFIGIFITIIPEFFPAETLDEIIKELPDYQVDNYIDFLHIGRRLNNKLLKILLVHQYH